MIETERTGVNPAIPVSPVRTTRKEIRRRVRRQVMLRRLSRELASADDLETVLRRPHASWPQPRRET
ncbi:MAG TPA: hypothetical protein VII50_05730 [Acidothermaceae bacterium]